MENFKFEFTEQEANIIIQGLQELPHKTSHDIIKKLMVQAQEQNKPKKVVPIPGLEDTLKELEEIGKPK